VESCLRVGLRRKGCARKDKWPRKWHFIYVLLMLAAFPVHSATDNERSVTKQLNAISSFTDAETLFATTARSFNSASNNPASTFSSFSSTSDSNSPRGEDLSLDQFIIGGVSASRNEYEEYVLVIFTDGQGNVTGLCGGSLIARNKVLTAAHCAQNRTSTYFVIPGFYSFRDRIRQNDLFRVSRIVDHPEYVESTINNDVAVFTLNRNADGPFLSVFQAGSELTGREATVIGTGLTSTRPDRVSDFLQEVDTPIISNSQCNDLYQQFIGIRPVTSTMLCAGFVNNSRGSCSGDSGGPLILTLGNKRVIVGTVSFGLTDCVNRGTSAYARMSAVSDFVRAQSPETNFVSIGTVAPMIMLLLDDNEPAIPL